LKELVDSVRRSGKENTVSIGNSLQGMDDLLSMRKPQNRLSQLIVNELTRQKLDRIINEQRHLVTLKNHGLSPRRKILLAGPPGTGKTLTASILAAELGFPLFLVRLDSLITKFMGESAAKLRRVFDSVDKVRGVYFFDEFDALGSKRSMSNDVGEARRILNSFLQMIEQDNSNSLIICATNHIEILDHALFRRFDDIVKYELPSEEEIQTILKSKLSRVTAKNFPWKRISKLAIGLSSADITRIADEALKYMLISGLDTLSASLIEYAVADQKDLKAHFTL
jgi:SpoVK/Ycf46/Vps4 family AAA+-type ATPase